MKTIRMRRAVLLILLLAAACFTLSACQNSGNSDDTAPDTTATEPPTEPADGPIETAAEQQTEPVTEPETEEQYIVDNHHPASEAGAVSDKVLKAADFGAKGDGVTDDAAAVSAAVRAAAEQHATLQFEAGKTYLLSAGTNTAGPFHGPLAADDASDFTIDGQGCTFLMQPGVSFFAFVGCSDVKITNCTFDMAVSVYLVGTVESVSGLTVTFSVNEEPHLASYDFTGVNGFCIRYNEGVQNRPHRFISQMTRTGEKQVSVVYRDQPDVAKGDLVFLPNPGVGHVYGEVIYVGSCTGAMVFENINIRQAPSFIWAIKNNEAELYFENVDMMPDENDGRDIHMVSWRDGYHCKDNRLPFHWNECDVGVLFDDVFNISNTLGYVTSVIDGATIAACNYELYCAGQRAAFDVRAGDVVDVYDINTGAYCGCATVRETVTNSDGTTTMIFEYGQEMKGLHEGCVVGNRCTNAPGSTITNSRFTGTYRFLRDLRIENCTFETLAMWIMVEGSVEGPLPGNVDFVNCTINGNPEIDALNRNTGKYMKKIADEIRDIGFWGCTFGRRNRVVSSSKVAYTQQDTWTEEELFTVKNRKPEVVEAKDVTPTETDLSRGVTYDWTYYTMPVSGAKGKVVTNVTDDTVRAALLNAFPGRVLIPEAGTVGLDGLSAERLPFLYDGRMSYTITVTLYAAADGKVRLESVKGGEVLTIVGEADIRAGKTSDVSFTYASDKNADGLRLTFADGGTVYVGRLRISSASNQNPSNDQMVNGHTFQWTDEVTIGKGKAVRIADIVDEDMKNAILNAESGFTSGTVLHLDHGFGEFTGLTDKTYYTAGKSYHLSLDAYIASAMVPKDGTTVYLLALDSTPGNRVLAQGLFTGDGFWHFEMDWCVGSTGENKLSFYISNAPTAYPDVYLGDFTITAARSVKPTLFESFDTFYTPTEAELKEGYTFDFTEGNLLDTGVGSYARLTSMDEVVAAKLSGYGFGDVVYYCNGNFHLNSIRDYVGKGRKFTVTMQVYDAVGNLATSGARGVIVLLHMSGGKQNSAEVNYKATVDERDSRLVTLTFTCNPPYGTDDFYLYQLAPVEFIIGSITVTEK
ncbi:MAG: hypothetical protein MJ192_07030 [Clostridia bacterium]|nr:hypothetical protein [Clostridia bacterium]